MTNVNVETDVLASEEQNLFLERRGKPKKKNRICS